MVRDGGWLDVAAAVEVPWEPAGLGVAPDAVSHIDRVIGNLLEL